MLKLSNKSGGVKVKYLLSEYGGGEVSYKQKWKYSSKVQVPQCCKYANLVNILSSHSISDLAFIGK